MGMKQVKALVDTFSTRVFQEGDTTFGEVLKDGKVLATVAQDADTKKLYSWSGKAHNRAGNLKLVGRSTSWNMLCPFNFEVELDRALDNALSEEFKSWADGRF